MSNGQIIYLSVLLTSWMISIWCRKSDSSIRIFPWLLSFSIITEVIVNILYQVYHANYNLIYHIYLPIEYFFLAIYFIRTNNKKLIKKIILVSVPFYVLISLFVSLRVTPLNQHPGLSFNIEGILLITWSILTLFSVDVNPVVSINKQPVFWICFGLLLFHAGIFFFNFVYAYISTRESEMANELHQLVIKNLNYCLYIFFSVAFLCSERMPIST